MTIRASFKQADVERLCKGVAAAGLSVGRVEFNDNGIVVFIGEHTEAKARRNPLDRLHG